MNQIIGEQGDLSSEHVTNIDVVESAYFIWGGGIDNNVLFHFVQKYDQNGILLNEHVIYDDSAEYVLSGITKTFQWNPYTETFVYIHGVNLLGQSITEGYLIEFDINLDTTFTRRYNHYSPYTYPFIFKIEADGYIVVGEMGGIPNSNGTFIMKLDFEGNVLWSEIMQPEVFQNIYRNWSIEKLEDGYLIAGGGTTGESNYELFGLLTKTNNSGATLSETVFVDSDVPKSSSLRSTELVDGGIVLVQGFGYDLVPEFGNANVYYTKMRISKYNPTTNEIISEVEYFDNYEIFQAGVYDLVATPDGGMVILGKFNGYYFDKISWILKVDSSLNQEWYQEYTYETCNDCENILFDIEIAPDGGYVAAGSFRNIAVDPRKSTWLLKIDACGDIEWQGCSPVGVEEKEPKVFSVYPNPSAGRFTVESGQNEKISSWVVYNLAGQKVAADNTANSQILEINLSLPVGLYALELVQKDGSRENHKIEILK